MIWPSWAILYWRLCPSNIPKPGTSAKFYQKYIDQCSHYSLRIFLCPELRH